MTEAELEALIEAQLPDNSANQITAARVRTVLNAILDSVFLSDADLDIAAIESLTGTGLLARTATDTWALRTLTGTSAEITVTNGTGVSGNPTLSLPTALTFTGKTITGGTFASPAGFTGTTYTFTTSDDLNDFGPLLIFDRVSASPAAADGLMRWLIRGRDSAGNAHNYIDFQSYIADPTNGSEDGKLVINTSAAGSLTATLTLESGVVTIPTLIVNKVSIDDATFYLDIQSTVPIIAFDTNDTFGYDRSGNSFAWTIGGTQAAALAATGLNVTGALNAATVAGAMVATQAQQEAGTATNLIVTPGRQHFHPSAVKAWVRFDASSGTPTINSHFNITSLTDGGAGITSVVIATDLDSPDEVVPVVSAGLSGSNQVATLVSSASLSAGGFQIATLVSSTGVLTDCSVVTAIVCGDHA